MRNVRAILGSILLAAALPAEAGDSKVGNGGDAVVCKDAAGAIRTVRLLDFYEGEIFRGLVPELGPAELTPVEKAVYAFERLARLDPARSALFVDAARGFDAGAA